MKIKIYSLLTSFISVIFFNDVQSQQINNLTTLWHNTFSNNCGGFGRAIIDDNKLVISGTNWPNCPSGTRDQMVTKISSSGNLIFQTVRAPGGDHDFYDAVVKLQNGNYGFFGQQNGQGTQYFDGYYTEFDNLGNEVSSNFFSIPGSSSGSDMLMLPNGNRVYTGNQGGGANFVALTSPNFNQLNYQTFNVGGWNNAQLGIDYINNFIYAIGSELNTNNIQIQKYDFLLNNISNFTISNNEPITNYDVIVDGTDLLLCGYKVISSIKYATFYRINSNGSILDSYVAPNNSEFTAIVKYGSEVLLAKSNLTGASSTSNEIIRYTGPSQVTSGLTLNGSSPFVAYDLVINSDTLYAVGVDGPSYWIGTPAVEKIQINSFNCAGYVGITPTVSNSTIGSAINLTATTNDPNPTFIWQSDFGQGFQTLNNFGNYSGVNSPNLVISNIQLSEQNQPVRVISISGNCVDTSITAIINIVDTCITQLTIYDTILTAVTDTLIINAQLTGLNPPSNQNVLKVFPNPANTHITINYGNYSNMNGYNISILNSLGQTVFTTSINQQSSNIDLSTWTGNGIYYIQLKDPQNNIIENRKIILQ